MASLSVNISSKFSFNVNEYFLNSLIERINRHKRLVVSVSEIINADNLETNESRLKVNKALKNLISNTYAFGLRQNLREEFPSYFYATEAALSLIPQFETEEQSETHFKKQVGDKTPILIAKGVKNTFQNLTWLFVRGVNTFRKTKKAKAYWNKDVPLREVSRYFLEVRFGNRMLEILERTEFIILQLLDDADTVTRNITIKAAHPIDGKAVNVLTSDLDQIIDGFERLAENVRKEAHESLNQEFKLLQYALDKVGTIELNGSYFGESLNKTRLEKTERKFTSWQRKIERNHRIVKDNWILCHEINLFYETLRLASRKICDRLNTKIHTHLFKQIDETRAFLEESSASFETAYTDKSLLKSAVLAERSRINGTFKKGIIPKAVQMMLFQNLPTVTLALESFYSNALKKLNTSTIVKANFKVNQYLREAELSEINPRDLVDFEYFIGLRNAKDQLHDELVKLNNKIQPSIIEISNIHAYTFETAINNLEDQGNTIKQVGETISQGFERTFEKIDNLKAELLEISNQATHNLDAALQTLSKDLQHLNSTDNAFALNVKLLEKKAKDRTRSYWKQVSEFATKHFKRLLTQIRTVYKRTLSIYKKTESTLIQDAKKSIDNELASFLSTANHSFEKLPFIYRLLFRLEPLEDYNFYVERKSELNALTKAYQAWGNGKYANVLITGPKGAGLTSIFNKFSFDLPDEIQINRIYPRENISDNAELIDLLKSVFNQSKFQDIEDVGKYLVECGIKRVVLIDEFQRFFLRKINGFEILNELQKLIRLTHTQVFWIVNLAEISSFYLFKTTQLKEFFASHIKLQPLKLTEIKELIMKRHLVSGYKLIFIDKISTNTKKVQKLRGIEKQDYLANLFFEKLTKSSEGSLSLALLQWVMSVEIQDKQTILVNPLTAVKDVLNGLDSVKASILHALILHDGLNIDELNTVLNFDIAITRSHLSSLEKDGVIENKNDFININPLLHWSSVNILSKRNLIH